MKKTKIKINLPSLYRINGGLLILLLGSFLARLIFANHAATQSYEYSLNAEKIKRLQSAHEQLVVSVAQLQSVERLTTVSNQLNLVKAGKVVYLKPRSSVAINR